MEEDFLAENNPCGQTLLQLVSRGNAIIAELLRLKDHVPPIFRLENKADQQKYGEILHDYSYFSSSDLIDSKIESSESLRDVSDEILENHGKILSRFYHAYESIHKYVMDLNSFVEEVEEGTYIQQTLDTIFLSEDGIQLMCESVYLYGVMLFIIDLFHGAPLRERLVVAHSRYNITVETLDHVCQLTRATGFVNVPGARRPLNYPQDFFRRIRVNEKLVNLVIGKLRTEDIYHQQKALPLPQHTTTAFAQQAAILFVTLFFAPNILHNQTARMREIVDKYFPDNWIVNIYMGVTVNLIEMWEPFKAAKIALANTLETSNIREYSVGHAEILERLLEETRDILQEGVLDQTYLMGNINKILNLARECNVSLRWLLLHTAPQHAVCENLKKCKQVRDQVLMDTAHDHQKILQLLLNTAQFENKICDLFKSVLNERGEKWEKGKKESLLRINELTEIFSGAKQMMRVKKSESLREWFEEIAKEIDSLNLDEPNISARKLAQLVRALEEVQGFQQLSNNLGVKQLASETAELLSGMLGAVNIRDTLLVNMQIVSDFSYGWCLIDHFSNDMQARIKKDPTTVNKLRAVFLKLSSAMETPLLRINQANDGDLPSVSGYYSHQLLKRVRSLLQVIPRTVFRLMSRITKIQTEEIPELPPRIEKEKLKDYACLKARFEVAKLTDEVSVFSQGLLNMKSTLVGIVRVNPRELLEKGIREELYSYIGSALDAGLIFSPKFKASDLRVKVAELGVTIEGHKNSFEFIQDYISINGIKMWQEELKRVITVSVDSECRRLQRRGGALDLQNSTFMGRLAKQLILIIDPKTTFFLEQEAAWVDIKTKLKVVDLSLFKKLLKAISVPGLVGLDRIVCFLITKQLQNILSFIQKEATINKAWLEMFGIIAKSLTPTSITVDNPSKVYQGAVMRLSKLFIATNLYDTIVNIGNLQILRKQINFTLNQSARIHARTYTSQLLAVSDALLEEMRAHTKDPSAPCPSPNRLALVATLLDWVGANDPYSKIYITIKAIQYFPLFLFLFTSAHVARFSYEKSLASVQCKKTGEGLTTLVVGLHTLLRQLHPKVTLQFVVYCGQYVRSFILSSAQSGKQEIPPEGLGMMYLLEELVETGDHPRSLITDVIPPVILDLFRHGIVHYVETF